MPLLCSRYVRRRLGFRGLSRRLVTTLNLVLLVMLNLVFGSEQAEAFQAEAVVAECCYYRSCDLVVSVELTKIVSLFSGSDLCGSNCRKFVFLDFVVRIVVGSNLTQFLCTAIILIKHCQGIWISCSLDITKLSLCDGCFLIIKFRVLLFKLKFVIKYTWSSLNVIFHFWSCHDNLCRFFCCVESVN